MARGKLRILGSPQHLKSRHGGGRYRLELKGPAAAADAAAERVRSFFGDVRVLEAHGGYQAFEVAAPFALGAAFESLEAAKSALGLESYTLSQTTLDQVFLSIAYAQVREKEAEEEATRGTRQSFSSRAVVAPSGNGAAVSDAI